MAKPAWLTEKVETIILIMARRYGYRNRNKDDFEDFRAEAVAKLAKVAGQQDPDFQFEAFAARVVENMARDMRRKKRVDEMELAEWCDPADTRPGDYAASVERLEEASRAALALVQDALVQSDGPGIVGMLAECVDACVITREDCDVIESARRALVHSTLFKTFNQADVFRITERVAASCVRAAIHAPGSRRARYVFAVIRHHQAEV